MTMVKVYRFKHFDGRKGESIISTKMATLEAIELLNKNLLNTHNEPIMETGQEVNISLVIDGFYSTTPEAKS